MKKAGSRFLWAASFYENAFTPVPIEERKDTPNVLIITMGYAVSLSCFVIGTRVGYALPFWQAVFACVAGNLILMTIGLFMGYLGYKTGWSTAFLVRKLIGRRASKLVSVIIIILSIYWVGMNGDSFARMIVNAFPAWPIPIAVTAVILVILWGLTAAYGWRGLALTSWVLTPLTIILALASLVLLSTRTNVTQALQSFVPSGGLTLTAAIAAVTGNYIFGCILSPDLCRFAKSKKAVIKVIIPSYTIGFIVLNLCGVFVAQLGNSADFGTATSKLGLAVPFLICSYTGLWTTENYNMYGGSLAGQNLFLGTAVEGNLSHRVASWILAGLAAAFAALKALNYLMPVITLIAALVPPIAGIMFVEYFVFCRREMPIKHTNYRWVWLPAWIIGSVSGILANGTQYLIAPIVALIISGAVYTLLKALVMNRAIKNNKKL